MDKRKIKLLAVEQFPQEIEHICGIQGFKSAFVGKMHTLNGERVLVVTFFSITKKIAEYRMFFNRKTFVTEKLAPDRKWSNATLDYIADWHMRESYVTCVDEQSDKLIMRYFKAHGVTPYRAMADFQKGLRQKQLRVRHKKRN